MTRAREYAHIGGVKVKIAMGTNSQTVNVYQGEIEGDYRMVYRSIDRAHWVTAHELQREVSDLSLLEPFLIGRCFEKRGPKRK